MCVVRIDSISHHMICVVDEIVYLIITYDISYVMIPYHVICVVDEFYF